MNGGIQILNIGPLELILVLAMMILFLGPKDMARMARQAGAFIRSIRSSALWNDIMKVDREIRDLPVQLAREAGFEEQMEEIRQSTVIPPEEPKKTPGEVRSPGSRLRPPMRRGTPPPRTETPAEDDAATQAEPRAETEDQTEQPFE